MFEDRETKVFEDRETKVFEDWYARPQDCKCRVYSWMPNIAKLN